MTNKSRIRLDPSELRLQAEQKLATQSNDQVLTSVDEKRLLHELQVHQIELEMLLEAVNENLLRTQTELEASQARYFDLYDLAPVGYFTVSDRDVIMESNLTATHLLGLTRKALIKQPLTRFILPADQDIYYLHRKRLTETGNTQVFEIKLVKLDSTAFWVRVEMNQSSCADVHDGVQVLRVIVIDIDEQKANDEILKQAAAIFQAAREGVMVTDTSNRILVVNQAFTDLTGYPANEVVGKSPAVLKSGRQDDGFYRAMWSKINKDGYWQGEIWNRRKNGEIYPQMLSISTIRNEINQVTQYVALFSDITQLKDAEARLDYLAYHDHLTGLSNRLLLFSRLEHCISLSRRERKSAALLMMDLDRFKDVNDSFGHLAGDELLQQVAQRLSNRLRDIDTITRLGGDEFALLLENLSHPQDAALVATEIIGSLSEPWNLSNGVEVRIGVSIGISLFPDHGTSSEELLQHADAALYRAKAEGRGDFKYFTDEMTYAALRRINLESLLRRAMTKNELLVYYQPQINISTNEIVGAEVLLRWYSCSEGVIPPSQFIPVAEEIGLIGEIGEWVLKQACRQGVRWLEMGLPPLKLAVNVSLHQFRHIDIVSMVTSILIQTGFPAAWLELELTESSLMERESEAILTLERLRALGVCLAIDDFGTGYSSLAYLKRFPLDMLKIDKTFIDDIPEKEDDKEIAAAIIAMAHTLRLKVLAEGVETKEQLNFLRERGCDFYQGYYESPAVSAEAFLGLLQKGS